MILIKIQSFRVFIFSYKILLKFSESFHVVGIILTRFEQICLKGYNVYFYHVSTLHKKSSQININIRCILEPSFLIIDLSYFKTFVCSTVLTSAIMNQND